jgi:hypothetical protein
MVESSTWVTTTDPACDQSMKPKVRTFTAAGVGVGKRASRHWEALAGTPSSD